MAVVQDPAELGTVCVLGSGVFFWVGGFDIIYACQDAAFDRAAGLRSIPAWLGVGGALRWAAVSHALAFACFLAVGWIAPPDLGISWLYLGTVWGIGGLLVYQHRLVRPTDLSRVNVAFFHVNAVISCGLLAAVLADLWWF
jgi:4-hydroxybenzoate polyprenyltransferase